MNNPNFSQIAQGSRMNPPNRRPRSPFINWADSLASARFSYIHDATVEGYPVEQGAILELVLFCQDFPVLARIFSFFTGTPTNHNVGDDPSHVEPAVIFEGNHFGGMTNNLYTTTQAGPIGYKSAIYGNTVTNGVRIGGYAGHVQTIDHDYEDDGTPIPAFIDLDLATNGAIMAGKYQYWAVTNTTSVYYRPVILLETDYTQAMSEADNLITVTGAGIIEYFPIVGIWQLYVEQ